MNSDPEQDDVAASEPVEILIQPPTEAQKRRAWREAVLARYKHCCANCGGLDHLIVDMVVPEAAGGLLIESNGVTICRACQVAAKAADKAAESGNVKRRPVNVWISRPLYDRLTSSLELAAGFRSMGSLVRYMMERVVAHPDLFEDLVNYQDTGMDVKINVWVEPAVYEDFKGVLATKKLSVTDAVKALFCMYLDYMSQRKN
jgi:hypothetical protein